MSKNFKFKLFFSIFCVYFIWGSTFLAVKIALIKISPIFLSSVRFIIAGLILYLISLKFNNHKITKKQFLNSILIGFLLTGIGNASIAFALKTMPSGIVALLTGAIPIFIVILDYIFFSKQKPNLSIILGVLLGLIGMIYLINPFEIKLEINFLATLVSILGVISWAYGSLLAPKIDLPASLQKTSIQMFFGGLFSLIISFFLENNHSGSLKLLDSNTIKALIYLIFIGTFLGYTSYTWLIDNVSPEIASTYALVNPVVALLLGSFFLNEKISRDSIIATFIIIIGLFFIIFNKKISAVLKGF